MVGKIFLKGLVTMFPLVVTVWAIIWLAVTAEAMLGAALKAILPEAIYVPGMGVLMGVIFIFIAGLLLNVVVARAFFHRFEALLNRLPLIKSVYGSVKDLMAYFMDNKTKGQQVVMVTLGTPFIPPRTVQLLKPTQAQEAAQAAGSQSTSPAVPSDAQLLSPTDRPMRLMGLVTRTTFDELPAGVGDSDMIAVYLPMSYQLGGFTVMVRRDQVQTIDMTTEDALRFCLTAGMTTTRAPVQQTETLMHK